MATITESQWVNYFGFQRFPFDRPESGNEEFARPDFLASCFVEPKSFERVFGQADAPVTSLLFAARGTGKTACRVMMDYYCKNGLARLSNPKPGEPCYVLSVPHIRIDHIREIARQAYPRIKNPPILVEHHAEEIMRQAIPVFVDMLAQVPEFVYKIDASSEDDYQDLCFFIIRYSFYLSTAQIRFLLDLETRISPESPTLKNFIGSGTNPIGPKSKGSFQFQQRLKTSPLFHIEEWSKSMRKLGIFATYVLIDGVDEIMESAGDPNRAYLLIKPLVTHLRLMDGTPYFAMKFFLPSDEQSIVNSDPAFRKDRGFVIKEIDWDEKDLINILRERLNVLRRTDYEIRDRTAAGFDALCVPDLRGKIEGDVARIANGNPRRLMNFCAEMVSAHCAREIQGQDDPYQLSRLDYDEAIKRFDKPTKQTEKPGILTSQEDEPDVFKVGQIIDEKYEVKKVMTKGGAGQVYCAFDPMFERLCALKIYDNSAISADPFKKEFNSLRRINHPNIVRIYDWGVLKQSKRLYMTSEFVDGHDLTFYTVRENLLPLNRSVEIILELLLALEYLHPDVDRLSELQKKMKESEISQEEFDEYLLLREQGWLHRDIKPANLVLSEEGLKLIDFNIAAEIGKAGRTFSGTQEYMLPEIGMIPWSTDGDLFATAIVLYELITGNHPYPDCKPYIDTEPTDPRKYVPDLKFELVALLMNATSCSPNVRYHSAKLFRRDLLALDGTYIEKRD
jgi:hypothetical protein